MISQCKRFRLGRRRREVQTEEFGEEEVRIEEGMEKEEEE
jgi:hypothetical protein